jgi:hypothetical protein
MSMHPIIPRLLQGRTSGKIRTLLSIIFMIAGCPAWADIYQSEEVFLNQDLINMGVPNDTPLAFSPDTHLCVLSRYYGLGLGGGQVYIGKDNLWHLKLLAKDAQIFARCFKTSVFTYPWGNEHWISDNFEVTADAPSGYCLKKEVDTWWSDAATILQGYKGLGVYQQESVAIVQEPVQKFVSSKAVANDCDFGSVTAYANSFFVGAPHSGQLARFFGPLGKGSAAQAGEYSVKANYRLTGGAPATVNMAPVDEAICYFTAIEGAFGAGEQDVSSEVAILSTEIVGGKPAWQLKAYSNQRGNSGSNYVSAKARCFLREQPGYPTDGNNPRPICLKACSDSKNQCIGQVATPALVGACGKAYNYCVSKCP